MRRTLIGLTCTVLLFGCASTEQPSTGQVYDPLEGWNRGVYSFNEGVDKAVLGPVADGYRYVTNEPIRAGVNNFLSNLGQPVVFANTILQGKPQAAVDTFSRFAVNTTWGLGGIFDLASSMGVPKHSEDFGQTLGHWGVPGGAYIVVPLAGPSNVRDFLGRGVDAAFNPLNYAQYEHDDQVRIGLAVLGAVAARERLDESIEILREQPEPYTALRRNYTQSRNAAIRDGKPEEDPFANLPDFDDYDFGDEEEGTD